MNVDAAHPYRRAGAVIVAGSFVWEIGVSPAPRVYTTADAADRLAILQRARRTWVAGQFLTAAGTAAVPAGFAGLASALPPGVSKKLTTTAAAALLSAPVFASILVAKKDIPRFVFYLVEQAAGIYLCFYREPERAVLVNMGRRGR